MHGDAHGRKETVGLSDGLLRDLPFGQGGFGLRTGRDKMSFGRESFFVSLSIEILGCIDYSSIMIYQIRGTVI